MFKFAKLARTLALGNIFVWMSLDWLNFYQLGWYEATTLGLVLFVMQYIVYNIGLKMTANEKNKKASPLKKALICSGITLNDSISEEKVREKYSGKNVKILHGLPLIGIIFCTGIFAYDNHPMVIAWLFFFAALALATQPIYAALVQEEAEIAEAN